MRKCLCLGLSWLLAVVLLASPALLHAQWPDGVRIEDTPHNLMVPAVVTDPEMAGLVEDYGSVCVYCHAPHAGDTDRPLWNRFTPSGPFRMFEAEIMIIDPQPTGNSLACLCCHDGTIGLDEVRDFPSNYSGPGAASTSIEECEDCHRGGDPPGGIDWEGVYLDTDLRKHHPISFVYDPSRDPDFRSTAEIEAAGLVLYDGKVQCMTCHEPHTQQFRPFLRLPNSQSLCFTCHRSDPGESTAHDW